MTSHNEAQKTADLGKKYLYALRSLHHASISHDDTKELEAYVQDVEAEILEAQKTKADWLRSEIEKLEGMRKECRECEGTGDGADNPNSDHGECYPCFKCKGAGKKKNLTLTSIITRYKEELKVLESK